MRFHLVDRILDVQPGKGLRAVKNLTLGEEYLADHFPTFPVMPGVLMLQALVEAGAWLLRATDNFSHSIIVLREARGVKYGSFMEPGRQMTISMELIARDDGTATLPLVGVVKVGGSTVGQVEDDLKNRLNLYDPCVGHHDVKATQRVDGFADCPEDGFAVTYVPWHADSSSTEVLNVCDDVKDTLGVPAIDRDIKAIPS